jgi:hypothetical protein
MNAIQIPKNQTHTCVSSIAVLVTNIVNLALVTALTNVRPATPLPTSLEEAVNASTMMNSIRLTTKNQVRATAFLLRPMVVPLEITGLELPALHVMLHASTATEVALMTVYQW